MSRFSPDTWLDAIQLPFAMVQFKGSVYVEPIAPDLRPAAFIILLIAACLAPLIRKRRKNSPLYGVAAQYNRRSAWALITATVLVLSAWIVTSGNGRYGLLAITLSPLAALAALLITTSSSRARFVILGLILAVQAVFLLTADPDDTWSRLTLYHWKERHADQLPAEVVLPWRNAADTHSVLVVTTKTLTGMSTLYQVFGPKAQYMGLGYLDQYPVDSPEHRRAIRLGQSAEVFFLSRGVAANPKISDRITMISSPVTNDEHQRLRRFGFAVKKDAQCALLPARMGAQLQICQLIKVAPERIDPSTQLPQAPLRLLQTLGAKCPGIFGDSRSPLHDDAGGILTSVHDGKYFLEIKSNLDTYIRHRGETEHRLLLSGESATQLGQYSCTSIIEAGRQYWR